MVEFVGDMIILKREAGALELRAHGNGDCHRSLKTVTGSFKRRAGRKCVPQDNEGTGWAPRIEVLEPPENQRSVVFEPRIRMLIARMKKIIEAVDRYGICVFREAAE